jgi:4-hydroxy-3-polyprenylbenzoate decarboxylase
MLHTNNPITVVSVKKTRSLKECFEAIKYLNGSLRIVVFVNEEKNDIANPYMLVWRVVNNIDATRDIFMVENMVGIDGTNKNNLDGFHREWPGDVECTQGVISNLKTRNLWTLDDNLSQKYQI